MNINTHVIIGVNRNLWKETGSRRLRCLGRVEHYEIVLEFVCWNVGVRQFSVTPLVFEKCVLELFKRSLGMYGEEFLEIKDKSVVLHLIDANR